jgi:hypothetical protein
MAIEGIYKKTVQSYRLDEPRSIRFNEIKTKLK